MRDKKAEGSQGVAVIVYRRFQNFASLVDVVVSHVVMKKITTRFRVIGVCAVYMSFGQRRDLQLVGSSISIPQSCDVILRYRHSIDPFQPMT